jgi:hypothetical protein
MPKAKSREIPDVQAVDPAAALHKLEGFTRRILSVPKKEIDAKLAREKSERKRKGH